MISTDSERHGEPIGAVYGFVCWVAGTAVNAHPVLGLTVIVADICFSPIVTYTVPLVTITPDQVGLVVFVVRVTVLVPSVNDQFDTAPPLATHVVEAPRVTLLQERPGGGAGGALSQALSVAEADADEVLVEMYEPVTAEVTAPIVVSPL